MSQIIHLEETNSTNDFLAKLLLKEELEEGSVVLADYQTAGKGQAGNHWEAETGKNLIFSMLLYPAEIEICRQFLISQLVSVAIADYLSTMIEGVKIKWPNDIYVFDKKIAGILIENALINNTISSSIIGIGLNVNQEAFSLEIPNPTSLKLITHKNHNLAIILKNLHEKILETYIKVISGDSTYIEKRYLSLLYRKDEFFQYKTKGTIFVGKIIAVDQSGKIILMKKDGLSEDFDLKEIEFII